MKYISKILATAVILATTGMAVANPYIGAGVGTADAQGVSSVTSFTVMGGYRFGDNFGLETSYNNFGSFRIGGFSADLQNVNFTAVTYLPLASGKIDLFAKLGVNYWDVGSNFGYSNDGFDISYGVGAGWNITDSSGLALEYQWFEIDGGDLTNIALNYRFTFK